MEGLSREQLDGFYERGYVVAEGLLDPAGDLDPVIAEYHTVLDNLADELHAQGEISGPHDGLDFNERYMRICEESGRIHSQYFDFMLPKRNVKPDSPLWVGPAVFHMIRNERLLDAVEQLIGPEIYSNPVQHVRMKTPEHRTPLNPQTGRIQMGATPWHQDGGVVNEDADGTEMITVWFPLWDAPVEAGCLEVIPYSHLQGLRRHCASPTGGGPRLHDAVIEREAAVALPMRRGDVLFMTRYTKHASLPNLSDSMRWSFDLRYIPTGQPTGREVFPGFVARSRRDPASELRDPRAWAQLWYDTRARMAAPEYEDFSYNRWTVDFPGC